MKNHSTTAPAIASSTIRNGRPSLRCSFSRVSGPKARNRPPIPCARPIQARTMIGGFSVSPTYRFGAGAGFRAPDDARDDDAFAGARPCLVGLVLLAMPPRYGGGAENARNDAAAGIRLPGRESDQRRRLTIVSRPIP